MMSKRKVMFAALVAFMAFFAGVAGASEYVGYWVSAEGRGEDGKEVSEFIEESIPIKDLMHFQLAEDGSFTLVSMGETAEGKWKTNEKGITLEIQGGDGPMQASLEDGKLLFSQEGMSICFEKRPGAMDLDAAVKTSKEAMGILQ